MKELIGWELAPTDIGPDTVITEFAASTDIVIDVRYCPRCGERAEETHTLVLRDKRDESEDVGSVQVCKSCDAEHWMFYTRGPYSDAARQRAEKTIP